MCPVQSFTEVRPCVINDATVAMMVLLCAGATSGHGDLVTLYCTNNDVMVVCRMKRIRLCHRYRIEMDLVMNATVKMFYGSFIRKVFAMVTETRNQNQPDYVQTIQ